MANLPVFSDLLDLDGGTLYFYASPVYTTIDSSGDFVISANERAEYEINVRYKSNWEEPSWESKIVADTYAIPSMDGGSGYFGVRFSQPAPTEGITYIEVTFTIYNTQTGARTTVGTASSLTDNVYFGTPVASPSLPTFSSVDMTADDSLRFFAHPLYANEEDVDYSLHISPYEHAQYDVEVFRTDKLQQLNEETVSVHTVHTSPSFPLDGDKYESGRLNVSFIDTIPKGFIYVKVTMSTYNSITQRSKTIGTISSLDNGVVYDNSLRCKVYYKNVLTDVASIKVYRNGEWKSATIKALLE